MNQKKIGEFISICRKEKEFTQEQLAEKVQVSTNAVSKWERGVNLPDYSNLIVLCATLDISLNELFAGERLTEKEDKEQADETILSVLKMSSLRNRKYKIGILVIFLLFLFSALLTGKFLLVKYGYLPDDNLRYVQVYIAGEDYVKGDVDINKFGKISIDFDIGANKYGNAVFKDPKKAFRTLKREYAAGISLIQGEFALLPLTSFTYQSYKTYGWQVTSGTEEERSQARFVTSFLDIYENSFN